MTLGLTPSQTVGPFFEFALPYPGQELLVGRDDPDGVLIEGTVFDAADEPVSDAMVEIWQANRLGRYRHPQDTRADLALVDGFTGFGRCLTDDSGSFWFFTVKPGPVPGPNDSIQAPHINVSVFARGLLDRVVTRIYFPDERKANAADPVLALLAEDKQRETLVARPTSAGLRFDIHLQGDKETTFFAV